MNFEPELIEALDQRKQDHLFRFRKVLQSTQGPEIKVDGRSYVAFCSNDYLGLANHGQVKTAFRNAVDGYGVGSGAAHLVVGHSEEHHLLESELAEFTGREKALLLSTGYMANLAAVTALVGRGDGVFQDRLNHASLLDAGRLSGARFQRFQHNDMEHLSRCLQGSQSRRKLIIVDGVFSMDGDLAPLDELQHLASDYGAWLMVDDAHGLGCLGESGGGSCEHWQMSQEQVPVLVGTLGKAFGTFGAFIAGSELLIETLIQTARPYIYTTAIPPAVAAATRASLRIIRQDSNRRRRLNQRIAQFRQGVEAFACNERVQVLPSQSPIQAIVLNHAETTMTAAQRLEEKGFLVGAIRPPTVPKHSSRLRITLSSEHSEQQVAQLLLALEQAIAEVLGPQ